MKLQIAILTALAAVVALGMGSATAQSLRCNYDLASVGDSALTIFQKCGPPAFKSEPYCKRAQLQTIQIYGQLQSPGAPGTVIVNPACITVEEWTYNPGSGQFWTTFQFENGQAVAIVYGDRIR